MKAQKNTLQVALLVSIAVALAVNTEASARSRRSIRIAPSERRVEKKRAPSLESIRVPRELSASPGVEVYSGTHQIEDTSTTAQSATPGTHVHIRRVGERPGNKTTAHAQPPSTGNAEKSKSEKFAPGRRIPVKMNNSAAASNISNTRRLHRTTHVKRVKKPSLAAITPVQTLNSSRTKPNPAAGEWFSYFSDTFDGTFPGYWILYGSPTWGQTTYRKSQGSMSVWCAGSDYLPSGGYLNNMDAWMVDGPFDLIDATDARLYFDYFIDTEADYDSLYVALSTDGENFDGTAYSGYSDGWVLNASVDARAYVGLPEVYVGVQFQSDTVNSSYEGAYIDNIELLAYEPETYVDLSVQNPVIDDADAGTFSFDVSNLGTQNIRADGYTLKVYVDDLLDSEARNSYTIYNDETVTWDWQLAYIYPPGVYTVRIDVIPDETDSNQEDNSVSFTLVVGSTEPADVAVENVHLYNAPDGIFDFDIVNYGPGTLAEDAYLIEVYVDGELDSSARNTTPLGPDYYVVWDWQLIYAYEPGDHTVTIEVTPVNEDTNPDNNSLSFTLTVPEHEVTTDLSVDKLKITDPLNAIFNFRVKNNGPATALKDDYTIYVTVDGEQDSYANNTATLTPRSIALWDWQLAYIYPPGVHTVKVDVEVSGSELQPADNTLSFRYMEYGSGLSIISPPAFTGIVNTPLAYPLTAQNGTPPYTWSTQSEDLPRGVYLTGDGTLAGNSDEAGNHSFTAICTDAHGDYAQQNVTLILAATTQSVIVTEQSLPVAYVDTTYAHTMHAYGGTPPYTWIATAILPDGLTLASNGTLGGIPAETGTYPLSLRVQDALGKTLPVDASLTIKETTALLIPRNIKIKGTVKWNKREKGDTSPDKVKMQFDLYPPQDILIDEFTRISLRIGTLTISDALPAKAKRDKKAVFKNKDAEPRYVVKVQQKKNQLIRVKIKIKECDLVTALEGTGIIDGTSKTEDIPLEITIDTGDTGELSESMTYTRKGNNGKLSSQ